MTGTFTNEQIPGFDWGEPIDLDRGVNDCHDCGETTIDEFYIVHDHLWPLEPLGGTLCVGCLEERLGRRLTPADFIDSEFIHGLRHPRTPRLQSRLSGAPDPLPSTRAPA